MQLIEAKREGRQTVEVAAPQHLAPVVDILEALKMSLDQMKKPVRSASSSASVESIAASDEEAAKPRRSRKG